MQYSGKPSRCSLRIYSPDFCIEPVPSVESILLRELSNEKCLLVELVPYPSSKGMITWDALMIATTLRIDMAIWKDRCGA